MSKELRLGIGGFALTVASVSDNSQFEIEGAYEPFVVDDAGQIMLRVHRCTAFEEACGDLLFDSGGPWSLHHDRGKRVIYLRSSGSNPGLYQVAILEPDFRSGDIYSKSQRPDGKLLPFPLRYPLAEVLMMNLLCLGSGVLLHACGVSDHGRGLLFVGSSGAGKSTMADLWKNGEGVTILSDDRVIVREKEGRFWAYGTPWHGDARLCSAESVPLEAIFLIRHGGENSIMRLGEARKAVSSLLVRSFPTFWNAEGMAFTLEFLHRMSQAVPCYDLGFMPDKSVVQLVRSTGYGYDGLSLPGQQIGLWHP